MLPYLYYLSAIGSQIRVKRRIIDIIPILLLVYITAFSQEAADYANYEQAYLWGDAFPFYDSFAPGFRFLMQLGHYLGFNFLEFKCFAILVSLLLIELAVCLLTSNSLIVWSCYLFYPGLISVIQIRQTLALSIVLVGLVFLVKKSKYWFPLSMAIIIISVFFHTTCIIFIVIPILFILREKILIYLVCVCIVLGIVSNNLAVNFASRIFDTYKVDFYFSSEYIDFIGSLVIFLTIISNYIICLIVRYIMRSHNANSLYIKYVNNISKICLIFSIFAPVMVSSLDFVRLDRAILILVYIAASLCLNVQYLSLRKVNGTLRKRSFILLVSCQALLLLFCFFLMMYYINMNNYYNVTYPLFYHKVLIE